jgi:hypothetical protein
VKLFPKFERGKYNRKRQNGVDASLQDAFEVIHAIDPNHFDLWQCRFHDLLKCSLFYRGMQKY